MRVLKTIMLAAILTMAAHPSSGEEITATIVSCLESAAEVCVYDGDDEVLLIPVSSEEIAAGGHGELLCDDQGTDRCRVFVTAEPSPDHPGLCFNAKEMVEVPAGSVLSVRLSSDGGLSLSVGESPSCE